MASKAKEEIWRKAKKANTKRLKKEKRKQKIAYMEFLRSMVIEGKCPLTPWNLSVQRPLPYSFRLDYEEAAECIQEVLDDEELMAIYELTR